MAPRLRDRPHWIILRGGLLLLAAGGVLSIPLILWTALRQESLSWDGDVGYSTDLPHRFIASAPGASLTFDGSVGVVLDDPSTRLSLLSVAPDIVQSVAMAYIAWVLLLVVLNVNAGRSFYGAVPRLLATLGPVIAVAAVAITFLKGYANREIMLAAVPSDRLVGGTDDLFNPAVGPMLGWLFVALLVSVFARAFIEGRRLADDTEGHRLMPVEEPHRIVCHLDGLLEERGLTLTALADEIGVTIVNLSVLKNQRAKAIRFSTLTAICDALDCQPGDLFEVARD